jgi:hypothetical protein
MHASTHNLQYAPWGIDPTIDVEEWNLPWLLNFVWLIISKTYRVR